MAALDLIEAIIAIVWLMVFVSSVIRGVSRGLRRAEEEAARRARRASGPLPQRPDDEEVSDAPLGLPTQWPSLPGQPMGPVVVREARGEGEGGEHEGHYGDAEAHPGQEWVSELQSLPELELPRDHGGVKGRPQERLRPVKPSDGESSLGHLDGWAEELPPLEGAGDDFDETGMDAPQGGSEEWSEPARWAPVPWAGAPADWSRSAVQGIIWSIVLESPVRRRKGPFGYRA